MRVHLVSISEKLALDDFISSVEKKVPLTHLIDKLDLSIVHNLKNIDSKSLSIWGLSNVQQNSWKGINKDDTIFFFRNKTFILAGRVALTVNSKNLAEKIWKEITPKTLKENLIIFNETLELGFNASEVTSILGYKSNSIPRKVTTISERKSFMLLEELKIEFPVSSELIESNTFQERLNNISGDLSLDAVTKRRVEQHIFSEYLFAGKESVNCSICHKDYSSDLLVVGHIKKRSDCSDIEKKDLNVVMPVCKFGCDDLYEKGYILINNNGLIVLNPNIKLTSDTHTYINRILGNKCSRFSKKNKKYFDFKFKQFN